MGPNIRQMVLKLLVILIWALIDGTDGTQTSAIPNMVPNIRQMVLKLLVFLIWTLI